MSCSNHRAAISAIKAKFSAGSVDASSPSSGIGANTFFVLTQVLASNSDPANTLDLVGDGSGQFGQFCQAPGSSGDSGGATSGGTGDSNANCRCVFNYTKPSGSTEQFETAIVYTEGDLIRCKRSGIPSGVDTVKISLKLVNADVTSNAVTFNLLNGSAVLDLTQTTSYQSILRYQCKDTVIAPALFPDESGIYDPILSEDPALSYPLNFYTNNIGGAVAVYVNNPDAKPQGGAGFLCPSKPNDTAAGMDLRLFSIQSDGASKLIYPPQGSINDRATFYLAKASTGVFKVPVNAYIAPNSISSPPDAEGKPQGGGVAPSIGFGASPIVTGDGMETCPGSDVTIPTGYKWVKLWLFRASIADRKIPGSSIFKTVGWIGCNPGSFDGAVGGVCDGSAANPCIVNSCTSTDYQRRVMGNKRCYTVPTDATAHCTNGAQCDDNALAKAYANPTAGFTRWTANTGTGTVDTDYFALAADTIVSSNSIQFVSLDKGVSRYDFVFVVTPTNIMTRHFKNGSAESLPYTPYRYMTTVDCPSTVTDPDGDATCILNSNHIIRYGFKAYDVGTNGDSDKEDPARLPVFPVCALQPI